MSNESSFENHYTICTVKFRMDKQLAGFFQKVCIGAEWQGR